MKKGIVLVQALTPMHGGVIAIPKDGSLDINYIYHVQQASLWSLLTADVTTANVPDNKMYIPLTSSPFSVFSLPYVLYIMTDPGYDDNNLYKYSKKVLGIDLVCPVERYKSYSKERLENVCFYQSVLGQAIYSQRRISIEPLIEHKMDL